MIDHISLPVADHARSRAIDDRCLGALGYKVVMDFTDSPAVGSCGYGPTPGPIKPAFWLGASCRRPVTPAGQHIAFAAPSRAAVDAFCKEALGAGDRDNGPPGLRLHYRASHHDAFVLEPDGHRIEAACHRPG
jgi:catechol 2,3-dioxygenase-like lactoylglutathione lyase family enzyme